MASMFNICSLAGRWSELASPPWLVALNAVSLASALIANLALLLTMAGRLSVKVGRPLAILGGYLASSVLVALVAAAPSQIQRSSTPEYTFTQAYYYAIMAAAIYFITSTLLLVTVYGAHMGYHGREIHLTMSQRTLMPQTISFMAYLLGGAAVYSRIEGWDFLDAVYWADYTLLTVGIGNYAPTTHLGRSLLFPYATGGIMTLGLLVASIRSMILERGENRLSARMVEKERESMIKRINKPLSKRKPATVSDRRKQESGQEEFDLMRRVQQKAARKHRWIFLSVAAGAWFFLWFIGAVVFWKAEQSQSQHWSYFESLYFAFISLMTIGYGQLYPQSSVGKPFYVFWSLLAVPSITILVSSMEDTIAQGLKDMTLWMGELVVHPSEGSRKQKLKQGLMEATKGKGSADQHRTQEHPGAVATRSDHPSEPHKEGDRTANSMVCLCGSPEEDGNKEGRRKSWKFCTNQMCHASLLALEIGKVMEDRKVRPPRQYTYDEWAWFLKLIGEDEPAQASHRHTRGNALEEDDEQATSQPAVNEDDCLNVKRCSWLSKGSPLMAEQAEAEWVLEHLFSTLKKELRKERQSQLWGSGSKAGGDQQSSSTSEGR